MSFYASAPTLFLLNDDQLAGISFAVIVNVRAAVLAVNSQKVVQSANPQIEIRMVWLRDSNNGKPHPVPLFTASDKT